MIDATLSDPAVPGAEALATIQSVPVEAVIVGLADIARAQRAARQRRQVVFGAGTNIFHEPAWDILLDLFIAEDEDRFPDLEALCANAHIRIPTALRWITTLEQLALVEAVVDPATAMPSLRLSPRGRDAMQVYLSGS